jgi:hypothetical protein
LIDQTSQNPQIQKIIVYVILRKENPHTLFDRLFTHSLLNSLFFLFRELLLLSITVPTFVSIRFTGVGVIMSIIVNSSLFSSTNLTGSSFTTEISITFTLSFIPKLLVDS